MKALDKHYINAISSRLERFSWNRDNVAVFRCPLCNDSEKSKHKRRGYFFYDYDVDEYRFKCHNCHEKSGWTFEFWLKSFDDVLYKEYMLEKFQYNQDSNKKLQPLPELRPIAPKQSVKIVDIQTKRDENLLGNMIRLDLLPETHTAVQYVKNRLIPEYAMKLLFYTEHFKDDLLDFEKDEDKQKVIPNDERLVIPFWTTDGRLKLVQGRAFDKSAKLRYVTVKPIDGDTKIYGEDRVDFKKPILVVEGPIDSLFLPNCVATADADLLSAHYGTVFIPDNQYRNKSVCGVVDKIIDSGHAIVLFPPEIKEKDINDLVLYGGYSIPEVSKLLAKNVYKGLSAKLKFASLRKV